MGSRRKQIEEEFGEPLFDVIVGFAQMGYGKDTTARVLGYDVSSFRKMLKRYGWYEAIPWPAYKDQIVWKNREPMSDETKEKIRIAAIHRQAKLRKERMESGWVPVRPRAYHKPYLNKQGR